MESRTAQDAQPAEVSGVEFAEPDAAETKLNQLAQVRIGNMTVQELERFAAQSEQDENQPYRKTLSAEQITLSLQILRQKALPAIQAKIAEELRLKAERRRTWLALKNHSLFLSLFATGCVAIFWTLWFLIAGYVPVTKTIELTKTYAVTLPFALTRWLDVPCIFLATWLFIKLLRLTGKDYKPIKNRLEIGLWVGLAAGFSTFVLFGFMAGLTGGLTFGLIFGLWGGLLVGLDIRDFVGEVDGGDFAFDAGLLFGLACGLVAGLFFGLALALPIWLPILVLLVSTRYSFIKPRGR